MKMETAIIATLLAWVAAMSLVRAEIIPDPCNGSYYTPKHLIDDREYHARKNIITEPLSELHDFTGKDVKRISGKIQDYDPARKVVTIAVENGKTKKANLAVFSEADQAYVHEWNLIHEFFTKLRCKISPQKEKSVGGTEFLIWRPGEENTGKIAYDIRLENRSSSDLKDLTAEYCIYYELNRLWHRDRDAAERVMYGTWNIGMLAGGKRVQFKTRRLVLPRGDIEYYKDGSEPRVKLVGIRVRIYLPLTGGRKAMREFFTPDDLHNHYQWAPRKAPGKQ